VEVAGEVSVYISVFESVEVAGKVPVYIALLELMEVAGEVSVPIAMLGISGSCRGSFSIHFSIRIS
jgi:hypothetical protein